jgi:hypothetical protein
MRKCAEDICKHHTILCEGFEHLQIFVSGAAWNQLLSILRDNLINFSIKLRGKFLNFQIVLEMM